jgi:tetratricopeptide (TPR) repeat protein
VDSKLENLKLLDVHAMKKILISLLNAASKTQEEISKDTNECAETVLLSLQNLMSQNQVVLEKNHRYHLSKELTTFIDLARQFLGSENETEFFLSPYCDEMINPSLISYCGERFRLELDLQNKEALLRLIKISPLALREVLFGSAEMYKKTDEHIKELNLPEAERNMLKGSQTNSLIGTLLRKLVVDLEERASTDILGKREIKGWRTRIAVDLAHLDKLYLSINADSVIMLLPAAGKIEPGQLVSVTNYDLYSHTGLVLMILGRQQEAIENFDKAIANLSDPVKLKEAWNNKGLALVNLKRYDDALQCYDQAIMIDSNLKEAWYNKGIVYVLKGQREKAIDCFSKALEIDPNYKNTQIARQEMTCASGKS